MGTTTMKKLCWALYGAGHCSLLIGFFANLEFGLSFIILGLSLLFFAWTICLSNILRMEGDRMLWAVLIFLAGPFTIPFYLVRHYNRVRA